MKCRPPTIRPSGQSAIGALACETMYRRAGPVQAPCTWTPSVFDDARIFGQDVDSTETIGGARPHRLDRVLTAHVRAVTEDIDSVSLIRTRTQRLDLSGVPDPVEHKIHAMGGQFGAMDRPMPLVNSVTRTFLARCMSSPVHWVRSAPLTFGEPVSLQSWTRGALERWTRRNGL